jgi:hypothetical protein
MPQIASKRASVTFDTFIEYLYSAVPFSKALEESNIYSVAEGRCLMHPVWFLWPSQHDTSICESYGPCHVKFQQKYVLRCGIMSRNSAVGIATGYGLDD